jgi:1-acyl-sn-glycerol-3-phosphate acyltransferase
VRAIGAGKLQERTRSIVAPIARRLWKITTDGYDCLPSVGPAILCPNHISFLDSAFLMLTLPRCITFVGKAEYMESWKTKFLFPAMGMIPIDRAGGASSRTALGAAENVLRRGDLFGIFPEGTRSRDGRLYKGHTGPARLAVATGCPIYPVGIRGTDAIQPPDAKVPKPFGSCQIRVGTPVDPARYARREDDRLVFRHIMDEVMFEIRELTGQSYADAYAAKSSDDVVRVLHVSDPAAPERVLEAVG